MGGMLAPETTPGGGLTMTLSMPAADLGDRAEPTDTTQIADPAILSRLDSWHRHDEERL
jgi:two-component system, OmpR family, sensor histidine kinase KdpD